MSIKLKIFFIFVLIFVSFSSYFIDDNEIFSLAVIALLVFFLFLIKNILSFFVKKY